MEEWYEVWAEWYGQPPYVLIVMPDPIQKKIINIYDPKEGNKVIYQNESYEEIEHWLYEDEYTLVKGRMDMNE